MPRRVWIVAVLLIAALYRSYILLSGAYGFSPDTASYLNLARQLRGVPLPSTWDPVAHLPRDDEGARTPGYPLLLDAVFWADRHRPSPRWMIARAGLYRLDAFNLRFMETEENLRAVQLVHALFGLIATWLAYAITVRWTGRRLFAAGAALAAVGMRPAWVVVYEPWLVSETTAALVVLVWLWTLTRAEQSGRRRAWLMGASAVSGIAVLVRPALIAVPLLLPVACVWMGERQIRRVALFCLPCTLLMAGWMARNAVRYRAPAVSTELGVTIASHFASHPGAFVDDRVRAIAEQHAGDPMAGLWIGRTLMGEDGLSFPEASRRLLVETARAALRHPVWYAESVAGSFGEVLRPTEAAISPGDVPGFSRLGSAIDPRSTAVLWRIFIAAYFVVGLACVACLVVRSAVSAKLAALLVVVSAVVTSLLAHTENARFAFPCEALAIIAAAAALDRVVQSAFRDRRRWYRFSTASRFSPPDPSAAAARPAASARSIPSIKPSGL